MRMKMLLIISLAFLFLSAFIPPVRSDDSTGKCADVLCGPQSLLIVCHRLGVEAKLDELIKLSGCNEKTGATLLGLKKAAEAKGLHAVGMKIAAEELARLTIPAIAHQWDDHFVVVEGGERDALRVTDPPAETRLVPLKEFQSSYSGFAVLLAKDKTAFPKLDSNGPDLMFDAYSHDFGFIEQGEQSGHTFTLQNKGVEDLVLLSIDTSCSCTQASLPQEQRIPPGAKGKLVVGFDSTGRNGRQFQTLYVHSNDPISPVVQLQITAVIKPVHLPISVTSLNFGTVKKRDGATNEFSITDPGDRSLTVAGIDSHSPYVKATITRSDEDGLVYVMKVELQPGAPIGELKSHVTVRSNHPKEPVVEIPIAANVIGDIETMPDQFFLGVCKKGHGARTTITLLTTAKEQLKIRGIDTPFDYVTVDSKAEIDNKKYTLTATLKDNAPMGLIKGDVVIHTNDLDQPEIRIPLYALVDE